MIRGVCVWSVLALSAVVWAQPGQEPEIPRQPAGEAWALAQTSREVRARVEPVEVIAFGSCFKPDGGPLDIWASINEEEPDVFVFLGDNIYADTEDIVLMRAAYQKCRAVSGVAQLFRESIVLGTWDDHDYGKNDAGREYPMRERAQQEFLDFIGEPENSERRRTPGVYDAEMLGPEGRRVQVILLDTRYFRSELRTEDRRALPGHGVRGSYVAQTDPDATMLGEAQWTWLEAQLRKPADLRIIASSVQVVAEDHGFEKWANMPAERTRLLRLIRETGAENVVCITGDRHRAEISRLDVARAEPGSAVDIGYPLYDVTSSALNRSNGRWVNEINRHRVGSQYLRNNFGTLTIDWDAGTLVMRIHEEDGFPAIRHEIRLDEIAREE
ncbi:MAG: alkaline phosphatase D family protein [Planctomycetota bacterium]